MIEDVAAAAAVDADITTALVHEVVLEVAERSFGASTVSAVQREVVKDARVHVSDGRPLGLLHYKQHSDHMNNKQCCFFVCFI